MSQTVNLSDEIVENAKRYGSVQSRSMAKQIEHWANIGRIAEENPDLSYSFIKDILLAQAEMNDGEVTPYEFG
ncbi:MAG: ParD-like family protein [Bacteroidota bacterium]